MEKSLLNKLILDEEQSICSDCSTRHVPHQLFCLVDGTWIVPDGVAGEIDILSQSIVLVVSAARRTACGVLASGT
jgi:hypothetical protein